MSLENMPNSIAKNIALMIEEEISERETGEIEFTARGLVDLLRKKNHDYSDMQIRSALLSMERSAYLNDRLVRSGTASRGKKSAIIYKYRIPYFKRREGGEKTFALKEVMRVREPKRSIAEPKKEEVVEEKVEEPAYDKVKRLAQLGHEVEGLREIIIETYKLVRDLHDELKGKS